MQLNIPSSVLKDSYMYSNRHEVLDLLKGGCDGGNALLECPSSYVCGCSCPNVVVRSEEGDNDWYWRHVGLNIMIVVLQISSFYSSLLQKMFLSLL